MSDGREVPPYMSKLLDELEAAYIRLTKEYLGEIERRLTRLETTMEAFLEEPRARASEIWEKGTSE